MSTTSVALIAAFSLTACSSGLRPMGATTLPDVGEVLAGEFIISADLPPGLQDDVGLAQLDYDADLGAGLYYAADPVNAQTLAATLKGALRTEALVVENNRPARCTGFDAPNDPYRPLQWDMDVLEVDAAHGRATGAGVTVAVIDTGVSAGGEDTPVHLLQGHDFVDGDDDATDENGHGTHVAGTIAQATDNAYGVEGLAPEATLLAVRALDASGAGSAYATARAITWATDAGADVINLSLGSSASTDTERDAVARAIARGVVVVAASGNDGAGRVSFPAAYDGVIAVGALDADGGVAAYSNGGPELAVVAPGEGILQETFDARGAWGLRFFDGTSMATPHVAGLAALLLSAGAAPGDVSALITSTAADRGAPGWDPWAGSGLVDPVRALDALGGALDANDTSPAVISDVGATRAGTSLVVAWTTDEPTTGALDFEGFGRFDEEGGLTTAHTLSFVIDPDTTYLFTVVATDAAGNVSEDGVWASYP